METNKQFYHLSTEEYNNYLTELYDLMALRYQNSDLMQFTEQSIDKAIPVNVSPLTQLSIVDVELVTASAPISRGNRIINVPQTVFYVGHEVYFNSRQIVAVNQNHNGRSIADLKTIDVGAKIMTKRNKFHILDPDSTQIIVEKILKNNE